MIVWLLGCQGSPDFIEVGAVKVQLHSPLPFDVLGAATELEVSVEDSSGASLVSFSGDNSGLSVSELEHFGLVQVKVRARDSSGNLVAGGRSGPFVVAADSDLVVPILFLPVDEVVQLTHEPSLERIRHTTLLAPDGRVLLIGGKTPTSLTSLHGTTEWWSIEGGFAESGPELPTPAKDLKASWFEGRRLLLAGGLDRVDTPLREAALLAADGTHVEQAAPMTEGRAGHCLAAYHDAAVMAIGGLEDPDDRSLELFRSDSEGGYEWAPYIMEDLITASVHGCVGSNGWVVTVGDDAWGVMDLRKDADSGIAEAWRPLEGLSDLSGPMLVPRTNGEIWVGGGWRNHAREESRVIDPEEHDVEDSFALAEQRSAGTWRWWKDEVIAIAGGYLDEEQEVPATTVELYDLNAGTLWSYPSPVSGAQLEVLPGGSIALFGGTVDDEPSGVWALVPSAMVE